MGHETHVCCVTVSPSGSHIASGGSDGKAKIWSESGEGGEWARVQVLEDHTSDIRAVCFSPDGKQLATGSFNVIKIYSFSTRWRAAPSPSSPSRSLPTANSFAPEVEIDPSNFGTLPMVAWLTTAR